MNLPSKLVLAAIALCAVGVAIVFLLGGEGGQPAQTPGTPEERSESRPPAAPAVAADSAGNGGTATPLVERREVTAPEESTGAPQGLHGRVVDSGGAPVQHVEVVLFESFQSSPLAAVLAAQRNVSPPPIGRAITDDQGRYSLGVQRAQSGGYELRLRHEEFAHGSVPQVTIQPGQWTRVPDVALDRGVVLEGRVSVQGGGGLPVAGATVTVLAAGLVPTSDLLGTRDPGRSATTDAAGLYRLEHCPRGLVSVAAVAPGFARVERQSVQLDHGVENRVDIELPKGETIAGVVTDASGAPIAGATVEALSLSAKSPIRLGARTDADGRFEVIGLVRGAYQLLAGAPAFVPEKVSPVNAGADDERIVLHRQSSVLVAIEGADGRPVQRFDVELKAYDPERDQLTHVPSARLHRVVPDDLVDGRYALDGVDPGTYVLQVHAPQHAKSFSAPFEVERGAPAVLVDVELLEGGELVGTVVGHDGRALAGAEVATMPNGHDDNVILQMFSNMVPHRITRGAVRTGADGSFRFQRLSPGTYQLWVQHPEHYELRMNDVAVADAETTDVGSVALGRGVELVGTAMLDGAPSSGIRITVSSLPDPGDTARTVWQAETTTDNEGRFRFDERLAPGRYQARAARQSLSTPLLQVIDAAKSRQDFVVTPGQTSHQIHFTLTSD